MSTLELNTYMKSHPEIDQEIDNLTKSLSDKDESFILDSRMAWHFIPNSFKVFLKVQADIAAKRIYKDQDRINEKYYDINAAKKHIIDRTAVIYIPKGLKHCPMIHKRVDKPHILVTMEVGSGDYR